MLWSEYLQNTGHAIQKGLHSGLHFLEGAVGTVATLRGAMALGSDGMSALRSVGVTASAAAL
jgi:hypothetical protein